MNDLNECLHNVVTVDMPRAVYVGIASKVTERLGKWILTVENAVRFDRDTLMEALQLDPASSAYQQMLWPQSREQVRRLYREIPKMVLHVTPEQVEMGNALPLDMELQGFSYENLKWLFEVVKIEWDKVVAEYQKAMEREWGACDGR